MKEKAQIPESINRQNEYSFKIILARIKIQVLCHSKWIATAYKSYFAQFDTADVIITVTDSEIAKENLSMKTSLELGLFPDNSVNVDSFGAEAMAINRKIIKSLLHYGILWIHGAAISVDGRGYVFSAPSGTGKTTHIMNWLKVIPRTIVINGDKPFISCNDRLLFGGPWCGKEGMNTNTSTSLSGIIWLDRGKDNTITPISFKDILPSLLQQIYIPKERELSLIAYKLIGQLNDIPFYHLYCNTSEDSALIAYGELMKAN